MHYQKACMILISRRVQVRQAVRFKLTKYD